MEDTYEQKIGKIRNKVRDLLHERYRVAEGEGEKERVFRMAVNLLTEEAGTLTLLQIITTLQQPS